jgi:hypothetical protein
MTPTRSGALSATPPDEHTDIQVKYRLYSSVHNVHLILIKSLYKKLKKNADNGSFDVRAAPPAPNSQIQPCSSVVGFVFLVREQ